MCKRCVCVCVFVCVNVRVVLSLQCERLKKCVCVCKRERERQCVCVCECELKKVFWMTKASNEALEIKIKNPFLFEKKKELSPIFFHTGKFKKILSNVFFFRQNFYSENKKAYVLAWNFRNWFKLSFRNSQLSTMKVQIILRS